MDAFCFAKGLAKYLPNNRLLGAPYPNLSDDAPNPCPDRLEATTRVVHQSLP